MPQISKFEIEKNDAFLEQIRPCFPFFLYIVLFQPSRKLPPQTRTIQYPFFTENPAY